MGDIRQLALALPVIDLKDPTVNIYILLCFAFVLGVSFGRWLDSDPLEHSSHLCDSRVSPSHPPPIGPRAAVRAALALHGGRQRRKHTFPILDYNSVKETRREL
jgi:hypothetical protein